MELFLQEKCEAIDFVNDVKTDGLLISPVFDEISSDVFTAETDAAESSCY